MKMNRRPRFWFWAYNNGSKSVDLLTEALGGRIIKHENSSYKYRAGDIVINWGFARPPSRGVPVINLPAAVQTATSKLATFVALEHVGISVPTHTRNKETAQAWNCRCLGRDLDNGSQGRGITVYHKGDRVGDHRFYVKYFKKEREFRIHVWADRVIFEQEKLKKTDAGDEYDKYIRSHFRGWCFAFGHLRERPVPADVRAAATASVRALGLTFGAVDIGWNAKEGPSVFEVNTAPGLEETSLQAYITQIKGLLK